MFPTIITYFPLRFRSANARRLWLSSLTPTDIPVVFCLLLSLFYRNHRRQKQRQPQSLSLFVCVALCVVCIHSASIHIHTNTDTHTNEKEVEACFVFDNVISFLLVVCKHFISLKSGIFSLVPQLPIAIYVYLLIASNSICNLYAFFFTWFTCTHFRSAVLTHTHTHFRTKSVYANAMRSQTHRSFFSLSHYVR